MSTEQTLVVPGYQIVQYLGSGARSSIWQVRDARTKELFALKRAVKRQASDMRYLDQATNEYEVSQHLDHPGIRKILDMRRVKRWLQLREIHLVMEFCDGRTVQDSRPRDVADVARIFLEVANGLTYMNAHGFVHADMKPNNVLVTGDGHVKIIDLGQSCRIGTVKERIQGTPDFIAPEQVHRYPLDSRTDVFNFGATLYWTLTGQPIKTVLPKKKGGGVILMQDFMVDPPADVNPDCPAPLSKLVMDCIELQPSRRPKSMEDVAARLGTICISLQRNGHNGSATRPTGTPTAPAIPETTEFEIDSAELELPSGDLDLGTEDISTEDLGLGSEDVDLKDSGRGNS